MNNKYKYWFFYIKPEYIDMVYTEEKDSLLYAYTDDKEISNLFKDQRDMNKFFTMKKEIDKEEVNYLAENFTREYLLKRTVKTKSKGVGSKIIDYDLVLTKHEEYLIESTSFKAMTVDLFVSVWTSPFIFNEEYIKSLNKIGYTKFYQMLNMPKSERNRIDNKIQPDLLSTFIRHYGFLLPKINEEEL